MSTKNTARTFWSHVAISETGECWLWSAGTDKDGYGRWWWAPRSMRAHRFSYELMVGPIPDGFQIDHLCRNPACVNPVHLEPVTPSENTCRGFGPAGRNSRKTHCLRDHPLNEVNTYIRPDGDRACRTCKSDRDRAYRSARESV